jgi:radical SAM protein with 4Fe4S-binding SPASM domain
VPLQSTQEGKKLIVDLATFGVPVLLFSGGEPLLREDLFELAQYAGERGLRPVLSTNGTLITPAAAKKIKQAGFGYVGISLDGLEAIHDRFRGQKGAYNLTLEGFRNLKALGQRVGLRLTLTKHNFQDLEAIFDLIEEENIDRACFYHLVPTGRGSQLGQVGAYCNTPLQLNHYETRQAIDLILRKAKELHERGLQKEILTVDNHTDGVYLYFRLLKENPSQAQEAHELLKRQGGNGSGVSIACVGPGGEVHADQFWRNHSFGNVRSKSFGEIWTDLSHPILAGLRNRQPLLQGRCGLCRYLEICNGNLRVRAEAAYGDPWAEDPGCYLNDEEIGVT